MANDLTNSTIERQNILNNKYVLREVEQHLSLGGLDFEGDTFFTKHQLMDLFEVSDATIERYVSKFSDELKNNGYQVLRGKKLKLFKQLAFGILTDEGTKTTVMVILLITSLKKWKTLLCALQIMILIKIYWVIL